MLALALALLVSGAAASPDEIRRAARDLVGRSSIQSELPRSELTPPSEPRTERAPPPRSQRSEPSLPPATGGVLNTLAYVLLIVLVGALLAMLVWWMVSEARDRRRAAAPIVVSPEAAPAAAPSPLGDAEALALKGRYAEAVHLLLLRTLEEVVRRTSPPPPRSFTSREILARIPAAPHAPLRELVARVEIVHFGGVPAGEADWRRCAELGRAFLDALRGARA